MKRILMLFVLAFVLVGCADQKQEPVERAAVEQVSEAEEDTTDEIEETEEPEEVSEEEETTAEVLAEAEEPEGAEEEPETAVELSILPNTMDNIVILDENHATICDAETEEVYHIRHGVTEINEDVSCAEPGIDCMDWLNRYLEHNTFTDEDMDSEYFSCGFAPGDIWAITVDEDNTILYVEDITYWD